MCGKAIARAFGISAPSLPSPPPPSPPPNALQAQRAAQADVTARERALAAAQRAMPMFGADTFGGNLPGVVRKRLFGE